MNLNGRLSYKGNVSGSLGAELVADIEANPSGPATQTLVKIRVGDVIYSIPTGGGGGGTSDYNLLNNKPKINNTTLEGELTLSDLGIQEAISFPEDGSKYLDGNGSFSTPAAGVDYSTSEQDTGLKWIDGRTIYQKTFTFEAMSAWTTLTNIGAWDNSVNLIDIQASIEENGNFYMLPYASTSNTAQVIFDNSGIIYIAISGTSFGIGSKLIITVRYVKN